MKKSKIAIIVAGINESYQSSILSGIRFAAVKYSFDCYVFSSFTGMMDNENHDYGELNIFELPDFRDFDGAVLLTNTIDYQPAVTRILDKIKNEGIPAVSIDNDVSGLLHIGIDNKSAMREITEHFIKVHGFKKFNYISGPKENSESKARLDAFKEVLTEHGLNIGEDCIFYGDFRAPSGRLAIDRFRLDNAEKPDAIICANDVMAAAAVNRLHELGVRVPQDIAISGFDNTVSSHDLRVELTSVSRPLVESGQLACEMLYNRINDIDQVESRTLNMSTKFSESCGCDNVTVYGAEEYKEQSIANYRQIETITSYMYKFNRLSCDLQGCSTFEEYIMNLKEFVKNMDPEEFYFAVCDDWADDFIDDNGKVLKNEIAPVSYSESMHVPIAYSNGVFSKPVTIGRRMLFPDVPRNDRAGKFYYILPLHFGERCLGYMGILNCRVSLHNALFQSWCITINNSLENIRKLNSLDYAVKKLGRLYAQDTFSGIYNRNGFVLATTDVFRSCSEEHRSVMLMFIDLDGLKGINDTYGHAVGDDAIKAVAQVLTRSCTHDEIFCRFGGDEFIVFAADYTTEDAEALTAKIQENIQWVNNTTTGEYLLSASTGYVIAVPNKGDDLFRFVTEADKIMYETKRKKKLSGHLRSTK